MTYNFNSVLNEKYALKAYLRGSIEKNLVADLNTKLGFTLNLPSSISYPKVAYQAYQISKNSKNVCLGVIANPLLKKSAKDDLSYIKKPLLDLHPKKAYFYTPHFCGNDIVATKNNKKQDNNLKKKVFVYSNGKLGHIPVDKLKKAFLKFKLNYLRKASLTNKLYFLRNLKNKSINFLNFKSKISAVDVSFKTQYVNAFDENNLSLLYDFSLLSSKQINGLVSKNLKKKSRHSRRIYLSKIFQLISERYHRSKIYRKVLFRNSFRSFFIDPERQVKDAADKKIAINALLRVLISNLELKEQKSLRNNGQIKIDLEKLKKKHILNTLIKSDVKTKKIIKTAIKVSASKFISSRSTAYNGAFFNGNSTVSRNKSKRDRNKFHKAKNQGYSKSNKQFRAKSSESNQKKIVRFNKGESKKLQNNHYRIIDKSKLPR